MPKVIKANSKAIRKSAEMFECALTLARDLAYMASLPPSILSVCNSSIKRRPKISNWLCRRMEPVSFLKALERKQLMALFAISCRKYPPRDALSVT
jgi:hypothetical protein